MKAEYNKGFEQYISEMKPGVEQAIMRTLRMGHENAILKKDLLRKVKENGFLVHERTIRYGINRLRKSGVLIGSTGGTQGGYWICRDREELNEYMNRELKTRIKDMREQIVQMTKTADKIWTADSSQLSLDMPF